MPPEPRPRRKRQPRPRRDGRARESRLSTTHQKGTMSRTSPRTHRSFRLTALALIAFGGAAGCVAPKRFSPPPPAAPAPAVQRTAHPRVPARVVVPNVVVTELALPYPPEDQAVAREYYAVAIPNEVQTALVSYGVFSEVARVSEVGKTDADFVLKGQYRRSEFDKGKTIEPNELLVRSQLDLSLFDVRSGQEVFRKTYQEERKQPLASDAAAARLSPAYMTSIATDLSGQAERLTAFARPQPVEPIVEEAPVARRPSSPPARAARPTRVAPVVVVEEGAKPVAARTEPAPARVAPARETPPPARSAPAVAPPASADEDVEDWALRMRRGLTEPEP